MGIGNSKIDVISIPLLIRQLGDLHLPDDRHRALDTLEQIDKHLLDPKSIDLKSKQLKDSEGIYAILKVAKKLVEGKHHTILFYSILLHTIMFYTILFYFNLFYPILLSF